ncbi:hypothetical protein AVENLUH5627_02106 [Acinetobacter venetianus]|uniref:Uncharacterized protein n=1 Tax=Acinetobacter venetianus TaxID=52133 RepID=A0A150HMX4_9GAMM|nr:hypothetical protein [Acinetobacter venetianus]KXZ67577.1 hypothetical protein AVENLUH5627_02106 [Acinetobacter venetianus]
MNHVCSQLSQPDQSGQQTCISWTEQTYVPPLSNADRDVYLAYAFGLFAFVWGIRRVLSMFGG